MELHELKTKTFGELIDEIGDSLTKEDYAVIGELEIRTCQSLLGVDEKLAVSALLMAVINTICDKAIAFEPCEQ